MVDETSRRPSLSLHLTGAELVRWYWLKDELVAFARTLGICSSGGKEFLTQRIAAHLDGQPFDEPVKPRQGNGRQLTEPLSHVTMIPKGQRCSQVIRKWMTDHIGSQFHFDAAMRAFFADTDGTRTLQDALDHWYQTRDSGEVEKEIGSQFEYNRFTRSWYAAHPGGSREQLLEAWNAYRNAPIDERGRT